MKWLASETKSFFGHRTEIGFTLFIRLLFTVVLEALQQLSINFIGNFPYKHGEIDIFILDKRIAIFVDGTIWHGDPLYFQPHDILPLRGRVAKVIWEKDSSNNAYLESQGFMVLRFWETEITANIEKCLEIVLKCIQDHNYFTPHMD
jgi:G:T-mismatch repair DNA endonuclease (very short patch repair protein)